MNGLGQPLTLVDVQTHILLFVREVRIIVFGSSIAVKLT